jgi:hypothetical protein
VYSLSWRLLLAVLVAFGNLQFSQIRGRQPYSIVRNILYVIGNAWLSLHGDGTSTTFQAPQELDASVHVDSASLNFRVMRCGVRLMPDVSGDASVSFDMQPFEGLRKCNKIDSNEVYS